MAALASSLLLVGCGRHETRVEEGTKTLTLHLGNGAEPADLDPQINDAAGTATVLSCLYEGLVRRSGDGSIGPGMARRWEISPDGLTYTFHLRSEARWSNGEPVTASQFRESFLRLLDPQLACENAGLAFAIRGARDLVEGKSKDPTSVGIDAPDPSTLVLHLIHPASYLIELLASDPFYPVYFPAIDATSGRAHRGGPWEEPGVLVDNGPFTLEEWRPNAYLRLKRNPNYWDASDVRVAGVYFYPIDDEGAEERSFRSGELHVTSTVPLSRIDIYGAVSPPVLHVVPRASIRYLSYNVNRAPFGDARVRRAFALAIDRERLVKATLGKLGEPAYSILRPGIYDYSPPQTFGFDKAEAQKLLAAAGYPGGTGLHIEFSLFSNSGETLMLAEAIQEMWLQNLGVHVELLPMEFKAYLATLRAKNFQLLFDSWSPTTIHDLYELGVTGDPNNDTGASVAAYDTAFNASEWATDRARRYAAYDAMERANGDQVIYGPLFYSNRVFLVEPSVHGWRDNPLSVLDWKRLYLGR